MSTSISEGSLFHGMKVLAMPLRRYGIAWCWFTGVIQILSTTTQQQHTGLTTGTRFHLIEEATILVSILRKILFFLLGNILMLLPWVPNCGLGTCHVYTYIHISIYVFICNTCVSQFETPSHRFWEKQNSLIIYFQASWEAEDAILLQWKSRTSFYKWKTRNYVSWLHVHMDKFWLGTFKGIVDNLHRGSRSAPFFLVAVSFFLPSLTYSLSKMSHFQMF